MRTLRPEPLSAQAFAPFGTVIEAPAKQAGRPINGGNAERFELPADLDLTQAGGRAALAVFRAQARHWPLPISELERHALGSQSFLPLGALRFVLVVAPAAAPPRADRLHAFVSNGRQGVTLGAGTWHHALLALDAGDFAVIERAAPQVDCEVRSLDTAVTLLAP